MIRQQILYLWLAEGALDSKTVGWSFYDGASGAGTGIPDKQPPYPNGVAALEDGWFMLQSPAPHEPQPGDEHGTSYLPNEFIFSRSIELNS